MDCPRVTTLVPLDRGVVCELILLVVEGSNDDVGVLLTPISVLSVLDFKEVIAVLMLLNFEADVVPVSADGLVPS